MDRVSKNGGFPEVWIKGRFFGESNEMETTLEEKTRNREDHAGMHKFV